jgi:tRNA(fMet)-specific endonuclease VapC
LTGVSGRYLLDTNIVIAVLNQEQTLTDKLEGESVYVPSVVLGELYFGACKSSRVAENLARIEAFVADYPLLTCDKETAQHYGQTKAQLWAKGRPLPENDIWIAAIAQQHGLTLITRDEHFLQIDGLAQEAW